MSETAQKVWLIQDGGDFYVYMFDPSTKEDAESDVTYHYPGKVQDGNMLAAHDARQWFIDVVAETNNYAIEWVI